MGFVVLILPLRILAHTETDYVAVPAGVETTVTLRPTHGCGDSPSVRLATRVPVPDAAGEDVEGWTTASSLDGEGRTLVEWSGGSLPADEAGEFPVTFVVPDAVGTIVVVPFVQVCENGEELAWIDGDPESEYPAPRLLILAAGSELAPTIDDVPADAPGRELLSEIVDVDNTSGTTTTSSTATTMATTTTEVPTTTVTSVPSEATTITAQAVVDHGESNLAPWLAGGLVTVVAFAVVAWIWGRRAA